MSAGNLVLSLLLRLDDRASAGVVNSAKKIDQATKGLGATAKTTGAAIVDAMNKGAAAATTTARSSVSAYMLTGEVAKTTAAATLSVWERNAAARELLGIRPEKAIQNEIRQTEAAYQRLASAGTVSTRELGRAQEAARAKVASLRKELEGIQPGGGRGRGTNLLAGAMAVGGGYLAGKAVLEGPVAKTMAYDRSLADLSNTAYAGQSIDTRKAGMRTLDTAVVSAVRTGGGTREAALGTLDEMVASGAFSKVDDATKLLPTLVKAGTAANADPRDLARIAIRAKQTFGIDDMGLALDQALRAGQLGGFELKDMAKWLPQQMAMAGNVGMKGDAGFRTLLAANEAAVISAGTKDEAGNNVRDLLNEINTPHFQKHLQKVGVDGNGELLKMQSQGINKLEGTVALVQRIVSKDKQYQALQEKLKHVDKNDKAGQADIVEAMAAQVKGTKVGKIFHNQQSLMALLAIINNLDKFNEVKTGTAGAAGAVTDNHALIADTPSYKAEQLAAEKAIAMQTALDKVNPLLGSFAEGLTGVMREYPVFTAALEGGGVAAKALAASATTASFALMALSRSAGLPLPGVPGIPGKGGAGSAIEKTVSKLAPVARAVAPVAPLAVMWGVKEWAEDTTHDGERTSALTGFSRDIAKLLHLDRDGDFEARRRQNRDGLEATEGDRAGSAAKDVQLTAALNGVSAKLSEPIRVEVTVRDGNLAASVNESNARQARRN